MIYSLLIQTSPAFPNLSLSALAFAKTLLQRNHQIYRVFFYGDGVQLANAAAVVPQDEPDPYAAWKEFIQINQIDAVVCIAAALKRGVLNAEETTRYQKKAAALADGYDLSGLGQLIEAAAYSDKLITFA